MQKIKVYVLLTLAPVFWGANFHLAKYALTFVTPMIGAVIRFTIAAVLLAIMVYFSGQLPRLQRGQWWRLVVLGFLGIFCFNYFFMMGMKYTSAVNGSLIAGFNPLLTTLISVWLLRTRMDRVQTVGLLLSLTGVLLVVSRGEIAVLTGLEFSKGDVLMLLACLSFAFYNVLVKRWSVALKPTDFSAYTVIPSLVFFVLACIPDLPDTDFSSIPVMAFVALFLMGSFGTVLAYSFWVNGVRELGADRASLFMNVTLLSALVISVIMGQPVTSVQALGALLIITGVTLPAATKLTVGAFS